MARDKGGGASEFTLSWRGDPHERIHHSQDLIHKRVHHQRVLGTLMAQIIAYVIYGYQPQVGASADALVAFYHDDRTRILIAAVFSGLTVLNLLWFAAALR